MILIDEKINPNFAELVLLIGNEFLGSFVFVSKYSFQNASFFQQKIAGPSTSGEPYYRCTESVSEFTYLGRVFSTNDKDLWDVRRRTAMTKKLPSES